MHLLGALIPFVLFFIYDINQIVWKKKFIKCNFLLGVIMIGIHTSILIYMSRTIVQPIFLILAIIALTLLIYALFFALPLKETYLSHGEFVLCRTGLYAMCRHPGLICFVTFYIFLCFAFYCTELAFYSAAVSVLNLIYVVFQDLWSFPKLFANYSDYKKDVPFLFPNKASLHLGLKSLRLEDRQL